MRVEEDYFFLSLSLSLSGERGRNIYEDDDDEKRNRERGFFITRSHTKTNDERGFSSSFFLTTPNYQYSTVTNFE
jgi:hypothetical protein